MTEISGGQLARFISATALLALPAESQALWLNSLDLPNEPAYADELATQFDDGSRHLAQFVTAGWLTEEIADRLRALAVRLDAMSGIDMPRLWSVEALATEPEWEDIRVAARYALLAV